MNQSTNTIPAYNGKWHRNTPIKEWKTPCECDDPNCDCNKEVIDDTKK